MMLYHSRYTDRRILAIAIFVLLALLLIGGIASSAIVGRHAVSMFERALIDSLRTNMLLFSQSAEEAKSLANLAINLAASGRSQPFPMEIPGEGSLCAIWREDDRGNRLPLYGKPVGLAALQVSLDQNGSTVLLWQDEWLVQVRKGDLLAQARMKGLEHQFHFDAAMGTTADLSIAQAQGDGLQFFSTRLLSRPFWYPTHVDRDGKPLPMSLALQGRSGTIIAKDYRGKEVVAAYSPLFQGRLGMVQKVDARDLYSSLATQFWQVVQFLLLLSVAGALLLYRYLLPLTRQLRETQASLEGSLHENELILQCAGEGIYGLDPQGRATFVNAAAAQMLGYGLSELSETAVHQVIHHSRSDGSPYPEEECPLFDTLRNGTPRHVDADVFWCKDGHPLDVEYVSAPIQDDGQVTGAVVVFSDITQRRRHEATLARWQQIFEHSEWGIVIGSADGKSLELLNPAFARMHGYSVEELLGRPITDVFAPDCHQALFENIRLSHEKGHHVWESWHLRRDGSRFPVQIDTTAVKDENGQVLYRVVNVQDITERRRAEDTLRESEAHLARAQAQGMLGSWWLDIPNNVLEWSAENYCIFGIPQGTPLSYDTFLDCIHPDDRDYVDRAWRAGMSGEPYDIQHRIVVDGRVKWVRERADLEFAADGALLRGVGTSQDITELKRHEDELLRSRQNLRELAAHHERIREEERTRIAREVHDELGQYLTALYMDIAMLKMRFGQNHPDLDDLIAGMKKTIDTTMGVVRNIAAALRPGALDMGLVLATEWLLAQFESRTGIRCLLDAPQGDLELDDERATAAFRILQESLTNIARHAQARQVDVSISLIENMLDIAVRDNGIGFNPSEVRGRKTFGLMGIRERALMFGGESKIDSEPGVGTTLHASIPLAQKGL